MRRRVLCLLGSILVIAACDRSGATTEAPQAAAPPASPEADGSVSADAEPPAGEEATATTPEAEEAKKQAERMEKAYADLEAWKQKEADRWTDDLEKGVAALVAKKWGNGKKAFAAVLKSPHRHPDNVARDKYRHPVQTMSFFGLTPSMTVIEVGPGAGWYTEILAPVLAGQGKLLITDSDPNGPPNEGRTLYAKRMEAFLARSDAAYGKIERLVQTNPDQLDLGEPGQADMVLIIRGLHGRVNRGQLDQYLQAAHAALKPGGVLGIVQHRAKKDADPKESAKQGYLPQAWLVAEVEKAGFKLEKKSEINANPKDTTDHEEGVWTLPPTLALGDKDRDKYLEIGETDRMTLRFRKPK